MHIDNGYPLYNAEARSRMYYYPPPYYYGGSWYYATPWLWYDGNPHGGYQYSTWESKIVNRMNQPSPVTLTMWGDYSVDGSGTIYAKFRNDSTATLNGRVIFVITEDSLYYYGPNADPWHNHVARDYLPNQNGQTVNIAPGDSVTLSQQFTIQSGWDENKCEIVTWIQSDVLQSDSTKEIWQGGLIKVTELNIVENNRKVAVNNHINIIPNPCISNTQFQFTLTPRIEYRIIIYDVCGRKVRTLKGLTQDGQESINWDLRDDIGVRVKSGVYLYQFLSDIINTSGKIVVR